jgi:hypothetical protein
MVSGVTSFHRGAVEADGSTQVGSSRCGDEADSGTHTKRVWIGRK